MPNWELVEQLGKKLGLATRVFTELDRASWQNAGRRVMVEHVIKCHDSGYLKAN